MKMKRLLGVLLAFYCVTAMAAKLTYSKTTTEPIAFTNNTGANIFLHGDNEANYTFAAGATATIPVGTKVNYYSGDVSSSNVWVEFPGQSTWHGYWVDVTQTTNSGIAVYAGLPNDQQSLDFFISDYDAVPNYPDVVFY